jgi:hypothetical protein
MRSTRSFPMILALIFSVSLAWAHTNYATLGRVVRDPQHLIPHAKVTLTAVRTGAERAMVANGQGVYEAGGAAARSLSRAGGEQRVCGGAAVAATGGGTASDARCDVNG